MRIYENIIQGSIEWHEIRYGKIGGSTAGKLMTKLDKPVRECADYFRLLADMMEDFDPDIESYQSDAMKRGNELEVDAREEYERIFGVEVKQIGWAELDNGLIGISPDGLVSDKHAIEIKCPEKQTHAAYILDNSKFLETYKWQIVHYFYVLGVEKVTCISFRPENKYIPLLAFDVTPDTVIKGQTISRLVEILHSRLTFVIEQIKKDLSSWEKV